MYRIVHVLLGFLPMLTQAELGSHLKPDLGIPAPENFESVVAPDGSGLPVGSGSVKKGKQLYMTHCASCHGVDGKLAGNAIAGGVGSLTGSKPVKTVGSFWP